MKYKAVLFDMDGTILNTIEDIADCINIYLKKFNYPEKSLAEITAAVGAGSKQLVKTVLPSFVNDEDFDKFFSEYIPYYTTHGKDKTAPYPGIMDLLKKLKAAGVTIAVLSSKPDAGVKELNAYYFNSIFDLAVGDDFKTKLKPNPECLYKVLKDLGIDIKDAVYVGDSEYDVELMKNSGIDGIAVAWGFRGRKSLEAMGAKVIADSVADLEEFLFS